MKSNNSITFAIAYDFDGTLSPDNMQEYDFIPRLGLSSEEFWQEAQELSIKHRSDPILTYMYLMLKKASSSDIPIRYDDFRENGKTINFFNGVLTWFDRITEYGKSLNINVEHYIISSGLREIIEGTEIANKFKKIFASSFMYDANGVACWPALAINYTTKTQYLFRINKGALDENDTKLINTFIPNEERPIPFERMLFIGDGSTDIPCFRLMKSLGGNCIAVYNSQTPGSKKRVQDIACGGHRVSMIFDTDYSENSAIENAVKAILNKVAAEANMHNLELKTRKEFNLY